MNKIKIYAEIGINHDGKVDVARRLIREAAEAGVTGVKFQYRNLENAFSMDSKQIGDEILVSEITRNYLSSKSIDDLTVYAKSQGLEVGISFFNSLDIADFDGSITHFDFYKIPSVELCNIELVNKLLAYGKQVYVSLGCQSEADIEYAFSNYTADNWTALHCVSNYPVSLVNAKLGYLRHMANKWNRPFGYSSHDDNWEVCLMAMALGATVIERHITLSKDAQGLDHSTSSTPDEFKRLVLFAKNMSLISQGNGPRVLNQGEKLNLQNLGRSYYAKRSIKAGQAVTMDMLCLKSPCVGIGVREINRYLDRAPLKEVKSGAVLTKSAFETGPEMSERVLNFARSRKLSLPVRLHDQKLMENRFPIGFFEFHLSFGEVLSNPIVDHYGKENGYSVHLPDYINPTQLMDPFALDAEQARQSLDILKRTVNFARKLQDHTGRAVPVVGSFSVINSSLDDFYHKYSDLLERFRRQGVSVLPQWLPPVAWYFGGSVGLEVFNQQQDMDRIRDHGMDICMDICHLAMGDALYKFDAASIIEKLRNNIRHLHLADASGVDGEGMQFGEGDPENRAALDIAMDFDCMKVIEVWQGHLDEGAGFAKALNALADIYE